jgi:hypothetical protein
VIAYKANYIDTSSALYALKGKKKATFVHKTQSNPAENAIFFLFLKHRKTNKFDKSANKCYIIGIYFFRI